MSREEIADKVIEVIKNAVSIDLTKYADQLAEKSLFDLEIGLLPRDLLEIFFELQKVFDIAFEETDVIDSRFDMLPNIVECIYKRKVEALRGGELFTNA